MKNRSLPWIIITGIVCGMLLCTVLFAGCTGSSPQAAAETTAPVTTAIPVNHQDSSPVPAATTAAAAVSTPRPATAPATPAPVYEYSEGNVVAYTAASLKLASPALAEGFSRMYPGHTVVFNLDGTQNLKTQVQNGAYADIFISASNAYTTELTKGGYFVDGTVKPLTSNYIILILPATNPGNIQSLADLEKPGITIARGAKTVPVGTATDAVLVNLAKSTFDSAWNDSVTKNTVTYETTEPGVATKVALGEVDAGFVYESTAAAAKPGTYVTVTIPRKDNYLQTYTIGVMKGSGSRGAASDFENFMLSAQGQQILKDYGFRPIS